MPDHGPSAGEKGRLYLVPNTLDFGTARDPAELPDVQVALPLEAMRVAARLEFWVAENAKSARALLKRVDQVVPLSHPLQSLHITELPRPPKGRDPAPSPAAALEALLAPARTGADIGLVSEAGLPAVADPGAALVRAAHAGGIDVVALSGPSSLMLALAASGLNGQSFAFVGYLPTDAAARAQRLRELEAISRRGQQTQLLIETPYRNQAVFDALLAALAPATWLSVSCGLTLAQGWSRTRTVSDWRGARPQLSGQVPTVFSFLA